MANGPANFDSEMWFSCVSLSLITNESLFEITWFIGIAHTENSEDQNEAEEEFNAKSLSGRHLEGENGMSECAVIDFGQKWFQHCCAGHSAGALNDNVRNSTNDANFTRAEHSDRDSRVQVTATDMTDCLKEEYQMLI